MYSLAEFSAEDNDRFRSKFPDALQSFEEASYIRRAELFADPEFIDAIREQAQSRENSDEITRMLLESLERLEAPERLQILSASPDFCHLLHEYHPKSFLSIIEIFGETEDELPDHLLGAMRNAPQCAI